MSAKPPAYRYLPQPPEGTPPEVREAFARAASALDPFMADVAGALAGRLTWANHRCVFGSAELRTTVAPEGSTWTNLTLENGFQKRTDVDFAYDPSWRRIGSRVYLRGLIERATTPGAHTTIATIPAAGRPVFNESWAPSASTQPTELASLTTGILQWRRGSTAFIFLNGISWEAANPEPAPTLIEPALVPIKDLGGMRPRVVIPLTFEEVTDFRKPIGLPTPNIVWEPAEKSGGAYVAIRNLSGLEHGKRYRLGVLITP